MGEISQLEKIVGCKAYFRLKKEDSVYSGDIQNVDFENGLITFHKVSVESMGQSTIVFGNLQYYRISEIEDITIKEDQVNEKLKALSLKKEPDRHPEPKRKSIRHNKEVPKHLSRLTTLDASKLYMMAIVEAEIEKTKDEKGQYESELPEDCTVLDNCKSKIFKEAIAYLKKFPTLGVSFEGIRLGRDGQLCWILMACADHTMFFDIKAMGKECFEAGLKDILEDPAIMKVIHDCRRPSDILHHQYNIKLANIFDTQVAAVNITKMQRNDFPCYVTNLPDCLRNELQINSDRIHFPLLRDFSPEKDEEVWNLRPAPSIVYSWMYKHCCYLLALRNRQLEQLLVEFTMGVDIFLGNLRDANKSDANMRMENQHLLPSEFRGLQALVNARLRDEQQKKKRIARKYTESALKDSYGWIENCEGLSHPQIIASHDTIWHTPNNTGSKPDHPSERKKENGLPKQEQTTVLENGTKCETAKMEPVSNGVPLEGQLSCSPQNGSATPNRRTRLTADFATLKSAGTSSLSESSVTDSVQDGSSVLAKCVKTETQIGEMEKTPASLSNLIKHDHEKKENGVVDDNEGKYIFRPAGQMTQNISKKEQKRMEAQKSMNAKDLASKKEVYLNPLPVEEGEFDIIPYQSSLKRQNQPSQLMKIAGDKVALLAARSSPAEDKGGFKIDSFSEAVRPPPYFVSDGQNGFCLASEALAAILPRVEDEALLLKGSRTSIPRQSPRSPPAKIAENIPHHRAHRTNGAASNHLLGKLSMKHADTVSPRCEDALSVKPQSTSPRHNSYPSSHCAETCQNKQQSATSMSSLKPKNTAHVPNMNRPPLKSMNSGLASCMQNVNTPEVSSEVVINTSSCPQLSGTTHSTSASDTTPIEKRTGTSSSLPVSAVTSTFPSQACVFGAGSAATVSGISPLTKVPPKGGKGLIAFYNEYLRPAKNGQLQGYCSSVMH